MLLSLSGGMSRSAKCLAFVCLACQQRAVVGFVQSSSLQVQQHAAVLYNCMCSTGFRQCAESRRNRSLSSLNSLQQHAAVPYSTGFRQCRRRKRSLSSLNSFNNDDDDIQQLRRRLSKMERIVNQQQESIDNLKATLSQLVEVIDEAVTVINIQSTLDAYLMERVLDEEDAESQFGEDVLRRAAGLLSARKQIIHKWDMSGLAAVDLVSSDLLLCCTLHPVLHA
jgi:hypothetical protein